MLIQAPVGPQVSGDTSAPSSARLGRAGELIVQELHGRFYEQTYRGNVYSYGAVAAAMNSALNTTATLGATCTPIIGIWNPITSGVNAVVDQVGLSSYLTALQATGPGGFVWCVSTGNQAQPVTGGKGMNRKTLAVGGGAVVGVSTAALTGLSNNLAVQFGSSLPSPEVYGIASLATAAGFMTSGPGGVENFDGSLIVPPGGVLALLANVTPIACSGNSVIVWEEVPV